MSPEEKQQLFDAMGLGNQNNEDLLNVISASKRYPATFVATSISIKLESISVSLLDRELIIEASLGCLKLSGCRSSADTGNRPTLMASVNQLTECNYMRPEVSSQVDSAVPLFKVSFEMNPHNHRENAKSVLRVDALPVQLTYHADTIKQILTFFRVPNDISMTQ
ncbi:Vacuolar protein sorting-associated protein 13A [Cichlidogyrus casuarinus]|uniref:Vacuolar protein sorting-associated protein 13A n=1 Tax=Cichlidogyrus casuarinus TaxID=1844966 RepID=A0ABD2QL22_9PLAT